MNRRVVFIRHGQSLWNKEKRFTGWTDIQLSDEGRREAREGARILREKGFSFDLAFCSVLDRAIETLHIILAEMKLKNIPIKYTWRLNERHYGVFQGKLKPEVAKQIGEKKLHIFRRSYDIPPPPLKEPDYGYSRFSRKKQGIRKKDYPLTESLKDVQIRVLPYWQEEIEPAIKAGKKIIVSAHGNSIRALKKYLDKIDDESIAQVNIPTGIPLIYEFDDKMAMIKNYYLGDQEKIKAMVNRVKNEVKK